MPITSTIAGTIGTAALLGGGAAAGIGISRKAKKEREKAASALSDVGALTPQEQAREQRAFANEQLVAEILRNRLGAPGTTQEGAFAAGGDLSQALLSQVTGGVQRPEEQFAQVLEPQLQIAEDFINRRAQQRGLLQSGLPIEELGRAGVELSVQRALANLQTRNQLIQQGQGLQQQISGQEQSRLAQLGNLGISGQQLSQTARGRQTEFQAFPLQADLGSALGQQAALQSLPGQLIGAGGDIFSSLIPQNIRFQKTQEIGKATTGKKNRTGFTTQTRFI